MKNYKVRNGQTLQLPDTAEEWGLYKKPWRMEAAGELTRALEVAVEMLDEAYLSKLTPNRAKAIMAMSMNPVLKKWVKLGSQEEAVVSLSWETLGAAVCLITGKKMNLEGP